MKRKQQIPWEKLAQYFAGELTGEEHHKMDTWIKTDPVREKEIENLYDIWKKSESFPYHLDTDEAWQRLSVSMDESDLERSKSAKVIKQAANLYKLSSSTKFRKAGVITRRVVIAAATVLIILSAGLFTLHNQSIYFSNVAETEHRVITTKDGERASYILADGSRVVLHAGSRLEIPEDYNSEIRELYLEGEAYFETTHNSDKPFIVHSQHAYTRVVGTRFLVQAWSTDLESNIEVVVTEGQVIFGDRRSFDIDKKPKEVILSQNQRGMLTGDTGPVVEEVDDIDWYLGWTEGRLIFNNRELREVLPRLERWYAIEIRVEDERIASKRITAEIDYSLPMSDVLQGIALSLGLEIERTGRVVNFKRS